MNKNCLLTFLAALLMLFCAANSVSAQTAEARKFDEYGKLRPKDEKARLDSLAAEMKSDSTVNAYIISYGGRQSRAAEAKNSANKAKSYFVKTRKIKSARISTMNGGYKEEPTTELWLVPNGAAAPYASPSVDPGEVVPPKVVKKKVVKKGKSKRRKR